MSTGTVWAAATSTPFAHRNRYAVLSTTDDDQHGVTDDQSFTIVWQRRHGRRRRTSESRLQTADQLNRSVPSTQQRRFQRLLGKSTAGGCAISAAEKLPSKIVLYVDDVNVCCSEQDVANFVLNKLPVSVNSCFEVKPRRRRNEVIDVRGDLVLNRKAFRVCIYEEDLGKFMNANIWPKSVAISEWYFKSQLQPQDKRPCIDSDPSERIGSLNKLKQAIAGASPECSTSKARVHTVAENQSYNNSDQERTILVDSGEELMDLVVPENNDNDNQGTTSDNNGDA